MPKIIQLSEQILRRKIMEVILESHEEKGKKGSKENPFTTIIVKGEVEIKEKLNLDDKEIYVKIPFHKNAVCYKQNKEKKREWW